LNRETQQSRGFAFVEMPAETEGNAALLALNNQEVEGRSMNVSIAREKSDSGGSGSFQRRNDNRRW